MLLFLLQLCTAVRRNSEKHLQPWIVNKTFRYWSVTCLLSFSFSLFGLYLNCRVITPVFFLSVAGEAVPRPLPTIQQPDTPTQSKPPTLKAAGQAARLTSALQQPNRNQLRTSQTLSSTGCVVLSHCLWVFIIL